ncbi:MAG: hypothetical protein HY531_02925, partial [Chloroflexi bacterium]|nr:hypothetical protein [Chloroflexota bacterium]
MSRVGLYRLLFIVLIVAGSAASLAFQSFDVSILGLRLQRGTDSILGMKLGLDLQGGSHLVYQARGKKEITATFEASVQPEAVRSAVVDAGKAEAAVRATNERSVTIAIDTLRAEERDSLGNVIRQAEGDRIRQSLEAKLGKIASWEVADIPVNPTATQMEGVLSVIERRINPIGVAEPVVQLMGANRILVQLPGVRNVEEVKRLIGQTARLEIKERQCLTNVGVSIPGGGNFYDCKLPENHLDKGTGLTGDDLSQTFAGTHPQTGA